MADNKQYKGILMSTSLFGFVQIFNVLIKIILNKIVAILLGADGMGIIALFSNVINLLKTGFGLGISQSAVKDISQAHHSNSKDEFSETISIHNKIILLTFTLGIIGTILLSPLLSKLSFGNYTYVYSFIFLSLAVGISILAEGQLTLLKGMRRLKEIAKSTLFGSIVGLFAAIPFYYLFGKNGIVPSLIITSLATLLFTYIYVRKIDYINMSYTFKESMKGGSEMIKMGISLMFVSFIALLSDYIISSYISNVGSLKELGLFQVGVTILSSYFGVILISITTDYYPRISAINKDNRGIEDELNKQSEIGLFLAFPLIVLFIFLSPTLIPILFSKEFLRVQDYTDTAILGTLIILCSNNMGMILLAKQDSKVFLITSVSQRALLIILSIVSYKYWGLRGLGFVNLIMALVHLLLMTFIMKYRYNIVWNKYLIYSLGFIFIISALSIYSKEIENSYLKYGVGFVLFTISVVYCFYFVRTKLGIDINYLKNKIFRK